MRDRRLPDSYAAACAAQVGSHDVKAEKGKALAVIDAGDGRGRRAVELRDEEALPIDASKARGVGEAGIPALSRRPIDGQGNFIRPHRSNVGVHDDDPSKRRLQPFITNKAATPFYDERQRRRKAAIPIASSARATDGFRFRTVHLA